MLQYTPLELCMEHCHKEERSLALSVQPDGTAKIILGAGVLSMLRNPEWLLFAVNLQTGKLMLMPTAKDKNATAVVTNEAGIMEIEASLFVQQLFKFQHWPCQAAYAFDGKLVNAEGQIVALFDLKESQRLVAPAS